MRRSGYCVAVAVALIGGAALAELSQSQLSALTVLSPLAQELLDRKEWAGACGMYGLSR